MAVNISSGAVSSNVIFAYDMNNSRSFKGKPTTNFFTSPTNYSGQGTKWDVVNAAENSIVLYATSTDWVMRWDYFGWTSGTQYTLSFQYRSDVNSSSLVIDNDGNDDNTWNNTLTCSTEWQTYTATRTATSSGYTYLYMRRSSGGNIFVRNVQLEASSFASPFVLGTRTNTQAVYDMAGRNIITATNLTYNSNNTFSFNGSSGYMTTPHANIRPTSGITMEAWFKPSSASGTQVFIGSQYGTGSNNSYALWWENGDGGWTAGVNVTGSLNYTQSTYTKTVGQWYHYVHTYDGSYQRTYVNGNLLNETARSGSINYDTNNTLLALGGDFNGTGYNAGIGILAAGDVSVLRIYERGLSTAEVLQNYNALKRRYGLS